MEYICPRCGFITNGWDTQEQADARGEQHINEHETGELMQDLLSFEASVGFVRSN